MTQGQRQALADAFDRETDPLVEYADTFDDIDIDVFDLFIQDVLKSQDLSSGTIRSYDQTIREWSEFMSDQGRHPACPHEDHVKQYIWRELNEKDNSERTAKKKLWELNKIYRYWQNSAEFPHPQDYNPFQSAKQKVNLSTQRVKEPPRIPIEDLRDTIREVKHFRDRAFIITQLKLGLRATEMANIKISEIHLSNRSVANHYDNMGNSPHIAPYENAVYIPHDRQGNKSKRPRVLPIDDELRRLWTNYMLIRPDADQPWLFLSKTNHAQVDDEAINLAWKDAFHPEYAETQQHRPVTSHYGRHRFTTYWRIKQDINRDLIKYMRGDASGGGINDPEGGIDHYIHSYYEDIESLYREGIYKLSVR